MPAAADIDLASDLVSYAARLVRVVRRSAELPAGVRVLALLDQFGPMGIGALATADRCSQPTMSGAVKELVGTGWVTKSPHPDDSRAQTVTLTPTGLAELRRVRLRFGEVVADRIARHPTHSLDDLATAVAVLRDLVDTDSERTLP